MRRRCQFIDFTPTITVIQRYAGGYVQSESNGYYWLSQPVNVTEFDGSIAR